MVMYVGRETAFLSVDEMHSLGDARWWSGWTYSGRCLWLG